MICNDSQNYMMKFFDREINDIEEAQLKQHLKTCSKCSKEFFSLKEIFSEIEKVQEIEPPEDFERQVMTRIEKEVPMYKKYNSENTFVYNILLIVLSLSFVALFGSIIWENMNHTINIYREFLTVTDVMKQFAGAAMSMFKGITITIVGVAASLYKTYYYAYILLGMLLLVIQKIFVTMLKESNGGAQ